MENGSIPMFPDGEKFMVTKRYASSYGDTKIANEVEMLKAQMKQLKHKRQNESSDDDDVQAHTVGVFQEKKIARSAKENNTSNPQ